MLKEIDLRIDISLTEVIQEGTVSMEFGNAVRFWLKHSYSQTWTHHSVAKISSGLGPGNPQVGYCWGEMGLPCSGEMGLWEKKKNHRSGKWVVGVKIHVSLFALLILAMTCSLYCWKQHSHPAASRLLLNFHHLYKVTAYLGTTRKSCG